MPHEKRILADVGIDKIPFPITVASKSKNAGQHTVANYTIHARIIREFEASWIDRFIHVLHQHRHHLGTGQLRRNMYDYLQALSATSVSVSLEYPYFVEKITPVSNENCLVRYTCMYSAKLTATGDAPVVSFKVKIPVITTDPASNPEAAGGLFGQLSVVTVEVQPEREVFVEDLVDLVDRNALSPIYSFLAEEDQAAITGRVHSEQRSSVVLTDAVKESLARDDSIAWYSVRCDNFSLLHTYSTLVSIEKGMSIPASCYNFAEI